MKYLLPILFLTILSPCNGQNNKPVQTKELKTYDDGDIVTSSLLDKKGDLWFGTSTEGLYKFDGKQFSNFNEKNGLCTNQIWSLIEDNKGVIWMATNEGLCKFNGKTFRQISLPYIDVSSKWFEGVYPTVNPNQANSIVQDRNGIFWIGTSGGGAYKYDETTFESVLENGGLKYEDGLYHNVIQTIIEDNNGYLWFGSMSRGGLTRYNGKEFANFQLIDGLSDDMIRFVYKDNQNNIWIGTNGNQNGGIDRYDGKDFINYQKSDGLCSNNFAAIFQSSDGKIWLGSDREALCYFEDNQFQSFDKLSGIAIRTIIEDGEGNI